VGVLAGGIAHDFNNLLTAIGGNIGLAQFATNAGDNVRLARYLAEAERATLRARDLTQQLLTFARGGAPIRTEVDLGPVIRDAVTFALTGSRSRGCIDIASGLWMAYADAGQVSQVLHNLLLNADQAMPEAGTITISATNVNVADDSGLPLPPGAYVSVRVADHGGGIPSDMRERIFDPFFTTKQRGSGLGLASSFSIVKGHEGHIRLESELGKGSVFTVYLPAVPTAVAVREDEAPAASVLRPMRILVMDDEGMVADMLAELLRQGGHMPTTTAHGEAALRAWLAATDDGTPFDLAILDLTVPGGMGGADTLRMLKAHDPKVRAIASSGYATDPILAEYAAHGFVGRLAKPYRFAEVLAVLAEVQQDNAPRTANT
jgi:CheY-like chemotaxis protein